MRGLRDFDFGPVWMKDEPKPLITAVRAIEGVVAPGRRIEVQRVPLAKDLRPDGWRSARVVRGWDTSYGSVTFAEYE